MCYSAQIIADYRRYTRDYDATLSLEDFVDLFWRRQHTDRKIKIPKAMELGFLHPQNELEQRIKALIDAWDAQQTIEQEQQLFQLRTRLADAERSLQRKPTKAAAESQRIATTKIAATRERLDDLRRTEPLERDARIFPSGYAPVIVMEQGRRVVKPMRYQCRPAGKPAAYDLQYPGLYNARRDSLPKFWKPLFGHHHGVVVLNAFFENVHAHRADGRALAPGEAVTNRVLEFRPRPTQDMLVACLWSRWSAPGEPDLLSFAAITDEPPPEVLAAGHDRCVIPLRRANIDAWLTPEPQRLDVLQALLDDRETPYYEHRLAA